MAAKQTHVFRNYVAHPVENRVINQAKPRVGVLSWIPQRNPTYKIQPNEHGTFFVNRGRSGLGKVGSNGMATESSTGMVSVPGLSASAGVPEANPRVRKPPHGRLNR